MNNLLMLNNVSYTYYTKTTQTEAIKNLSFKIKQGEFVAIIGPSGCGKTTLLSLIAGLITPTSGEILINTGEHISLKNSVGYMLQKDELFPWRTIEKNIYLPLEIKRINTIENKAYASNLLKKYGLNDFKNSYPSQLSGGMRQRVALIRTLSFKPDILLLDEPFSALDYQTRLSVCDDVYKIITKEKKTVILVTHDISEAISMSDRIIVLTKRPSTILNEHIINLDKTLLPLRRREEPNFGKWFETLWRELNYENKSTF